MNLDGELLRALLDALRAPEPTDATARELAEAAWLTARWASPEVEELPPSVARRNAEGDEPGPENDSGTGTPPSVAEPPASVPSGRPLREPGWGAAHPDGTPGWSTANLGLPAAAGLDDRLGHARGLARLATYQPDATRVGIDLPASLRRSAMAGEAMLTTRIGARTATQLVLVVDTSPTLAPWSTAIQGLSDLARSTPGLGDVTVLTFDLSEPTVILHFGGVARPGLDPLVVIWSDGLAPGFLQLGPALAGLPPSARVAWMHPWPAHAWRRTPVGRLAPARLTPAPASVVPVVVVPFAREGWSALGAWMHGRRPGRYPVVGLPRSPRPRPPPDRLDWSEHMTRLAGVLEPGSLRLLGLASALPTERYGLDLLRALAFGVKQPDDRFHLAEALTAGFLIRDEGESFRFRDAEARAVARASLVDADLASVVAVATRVGLPAAAWGPTIEAPIPIRGNGAGELRAVPIDVAPVADSTRDVLRRLVRAPENPDLDLSDELPARQALAGEKRQLGVLGEEATAALAPLAERPRPTASAVARPSPPKSETEKSAAAATVPSTPPPRAAALVAPVLAPASPPASLDALLRLKAKGLGSASVPIPRAPTFDVPKPVPVDLTTAVAAVTECRRFVDALDRWRDQPSELQCAMIAWATYRLRHIQEEVPGIPDDVRRQIDKLFPKLSRFSESERPGFVPGLSLSHRPQRGTWHEDAVLAWRELPCAAGAEEGLLEAVDRLLTEDEAPNEDLRRAADEELRRVVGKAWDSGDTRLREQLVDRLVGFGHRLKGTSAFKTLRSQVKAREEAGLEQIEAKDAAEPLPADWPWIERTQGARVLIFGGDRQSPIKRLKAAFGFETMEHVTCQNMRKVQSGAERVEGHDLVLLEIRFLSHKASNMVVDACQNAGTPFISLQNGMSIAQVRAGLERVYGAGEGATPSRTETR